MISELVRISKTRMKGKSEDCRIIKKESNKIDDNILVIVLYILV